MLGDVAYVLDLHPVYLRLQQIARGLVVDLSGTLATDIIERTVDGGYDPR